MRMARRKCWPKTWLKPPGTLRNIRLHRSPIQPRKSQTRVELRDAQITSTAARIKAGLENSLALENLDGRRDWTFAGDIVHAMWLMLEQPEPDDFVLASGETHSVERAVRACVLAVWDSTTDNTS